MSVFVARQPIFDRNKKLYGYELLFRAGVEECYHAHDGDKSTLEVVSNSFLVIGFDDLTGGGRGFINFTPTLLKQEVPKLLPEDRVVVEVLEDPEPDEETLQACRRLKDAGFTLAMDDFAVRHRDTPMVKLADIAKVDFRENNAEEQADLCGYLASQGIAPLAEKVETIDEFQQAFQLGYTYFQGYFFSKPIVQSGKRIAGNKLAYLRLLNEINKPDISYEQLEGLFKQDVSLTYKLLRFINSAWFGLSREVTSIKHALVLLGPKEVRKWFALVALRHMADDKPQELILRGMTRARLAEGIGPLVGMEEQTSELFLMGMFSVLDALTDLPMSEALSKLPLGEQIRSCLLGDEGPFRPVYDTMVSYEKGQWDRFSRHAASLQLNEEAVPQLYTESLRWTGEAFATI